MDYTKKKSIYYLIRDNVCIDNNFIVGETHTGHKGRHFCETSVWEMKNLSHTNLSSVDIEPY